MIVDKMKSSDDEKSLEQFNFTVMHISLLVSPKR